MAFIAVGFPCWEGVRRFVALQGAAAGGWADRVGTALHVVAVAVSVAWVCWRWAARRGQRPWLTRAGVPGVVAAGVYCLGLVPVTPTPTAIGVEHLLVTALLVLAAREVLLAQGITLASFGIRAAQARGNGLQAVAVCLLLLGVFVAGTQLRLYGVGYAPGPVADQAAVLAFGSRFEEWATFLRTAVVEEMLITAVPVALLVACRPTWEVLAIPMLFRLVPHLYLGWPALSYLLVGSAAALIYLRYRRVTPMIYAHFLWNASIVGVLYTAGPDIHRPWWAAVLALGAAGVLLAIRQALGPARPGHAAGTRGKDSEAPEAARTSPLAAAVGRGRGE